MALERQNATVSLVGGLDTKTDPKQVVPGKLLTLENGVFGNKGKIRKRNGYASVGPALGTTTGVFSYHDEVLATTGTRLYSLDRAMSVWRDKGSCRTVGVSSASIVRNEYSQNWPDQAVLGNLRCVAWEDSRGGVRCSVLDTVTGQVILNDAVVDSASDTHHPTVVALDAHFVIFYVVTTGTTPTLTLKTIAAATPTTISAPTTIGGAINWPGGPRAAYDVITVSVAGSQVAFIARGMSGMSFMYVRSLSSALVFSADTTQATAATVTRLGSFWDGSNIVIGFGASSAPANLYFMTVNTALTVTTTPVNLAASSSADLTFTGGVEASKVWLIYGEASGIQHVTKVDITGYVAGASTLLLRSVWLASRAFASGGLLHFATQAHLSAAQQCVFVHDLSGNVVARLLGDGGLGGMSSVSGSGSVFTMALRPVDRLAIGAGGWADTRYGVNLLSLDMAKPPVAAELGNELHVSGGLITMYDGVGAVEHGFFFYPEITTSFSGTGLTGTYGYRVTYEWTDGQGNVHRSAPSPAKSVSPVNQGVVLTIPTLRITGKTAPRGEVQIAVYRTINAGQVYYRLSGILTSPAIYNNTAADTVTFTDTGALFADGPLQNNPLLYTEGNVLENDPGPACSAFAVFKNRLVAVDAENPLRLWYSKQVVPGQPVEWDAAATLNIDPAGGRAVTALAALDDKLVIFKRDVVFFVTGTGPDATGGQNDFSTPLLINTNSGCIEPRSTITASDGVMYQSAKGIFLLDRSLQDSYVGADVEAHNSATITGAELVPNTNEARFTLSTGKALMFDYLYRQWSVFTNVAAAGATTYGNQFSYITGAGQLYQETPGAFLDGNAVIVLKIVTGWLSLAGLQGFQRAYKLLLLGDWISSHGLVVSVAYDFDSTIVQTSTFTAQHTPLQWRLNMPRQKCQAVQVTVQDSQPVGEGYSLSALTFEVGVKRGPFRMPASQAA